ncbi:MAG: hypothetical protein A2493_01735 [Candidatus Magasanikbacteria bacterium RIFOXYC12_FULL_33_11]|uniref:RNA helicase n=1 Tax=Candidatus Magasanikbacteria bacterium RIFOXYC12_FULL_33_11 TaxID=1798701 RepID=A0A1F6NM87_9BACT|nr:MAG: hypothetical protein A2493_01735 [Candidatus Magasanikbacteria bacterium RIFOXYC12_FULL_33_11]
MTKNNTQNIDQLTKVQESEDDADEREIHYFTSSRQKELRRSIESQNLPVNERKEEVIQTIIESARRNGTVLLQGETGSGKSIYSPLAMREALKRLHLPDRIVMMQPRRDAASGISRAVAAVSGEELGKGVGFSTSEMKGLHSDTAIKIVTPGIFLRYLQNNKLTKREIGALILDEIHEGSIEYHLALGLIKQMQDRDEAPLVLLTSATLNKELIQDFFGIADQDYLCVEGRAYPVEKYNIEEKEFDDRREYIELTANQVKEVCASSEPRDSGDILVFLPGAREIRDLMNQIKDISNVEVLPLFGGLTPEDRDKALLTNGQEKKSQRRIIVATNIAETSVTVPGIKVVIDSCRQRSVRYNPKTGIVETGTEFISKDQAEQRAGRAGRISSGTCYRMILNEEWTCMPDHPESEITKVNLSQLVLRLKGMNIDPEHFPFIEAPKVASIRHGIEELKELGALDEQEALTNIGRQMKEMPFEPNIARMLVEAKQRHCAEAALIIAAFERESGVLLSPSRKDIQDATGYNEEQKKKNARAKVQEIQKKFDEGGSDLLKSINIFKAALDNGVIDAMRHDHSPEGRATQEKFRKWCKENYLKPEALTHIAYRLKDYAYYAGIRLNYSQLKDQLDSSDNNDIGSVVLAGHPDKVLYKTSTGYGLPSYTRLGGTGNTINLSPGSVAFEDAPALCVTTGGVSEGSGSFKGQKITRSYASGIHPITGKQFRDVFPQLVNESRGGCLYDPSNDVVTQTITYTTKKGPVNLGSEKKVITGDKARDIFAQALASGMVDVPCYKYNQDVIQQLSNLNIRSGGLVPKPPMMEEWYKNKLGNISSQAELDSVDEYMRLDIEDYCPPDMKTEIDTMYPDMIHVQGHALKVEYTYRPSNTQSGHESERNEEFKATINIPEDILFNIKLEDIPIIGSGRRPEIVYLSNDNYRRASNTNLEALKVYIDDKRLENEWYNFKKPDEKSIQTVPLESLPPLQSIGVHPIVYAKNYKGEDVFAHPAYHTERKYDYDREEYVYKFPITYCRTEDEARRYNEQAIATKKQEEDKLLKNIERERMLAPAKERYTTMHNTMQQLQNSYTAYGLSYEEYYSLYDKWQDVEYALKGSNSDPKKAIDLMDEIQISLANRKQNNERRISLIPEVQARLDKLTAKVARITYDTYIRFGLSYEQYHSISSSYNEAKSAIDTVDRYGRPTVPDPERAMKIIEELTAMIPDEQEFTSEQETLMNILSGKNATYSKVIRIRDGRVTESYSPKYPNETTPMPNEISIGTSGRALIVRGNRLAFRLGSGREEGNWKLSDGDYLFSRDASTVLRVEEKQGAPHGLQAIEIIQPDYDERQYGEPQHNQQAYSRPYYEETPVTTEEKKEPGIFAQLLNKFGKKEESKQETKTESNIIAQLREVNPVEKVEMTDEIIETLTEQLDNAEFFIETVRAIPEPDKKDPDASKISKLRARAVEIKRELKTLKYEITTTDDVARVSGKVIDIVKRSEKAADEMARLLNKRDDWTSRFKDFMIKMQEIALHQKLELEKEDLEKIKPKLVKLAQQKGDIIDLEDAIEEIIIDSI